VSSVRDALRARARLEGERSGDALPPPDFIPNTDRPVSDRQAVTEKVMSIVHETLQCALPDRPPRERLFYDETVDALRAALRDLRSDIAKARQAVVDPANAGLWPGQVNQEVPAERDGRRATQALTDIELVAQGERVERAAALGAERAVAALADQLLQYPARQRASDGPDTGTDDLAEYKERAEVLEQEAMASGHAAWQWSMLCSDVGRGRQTAWQAGLCTLMAVLEEYGEDKMHRCQDVNVWILEKWPLELAETSTPTAAECMGSAKKCNPVMEVWRDWYIRDNGKRNKCMQLGQAPRARMRR
jgi:hypothetical protein